MLKPNLLALAVASVLVCNLNAASADTSAAVAAAPMRARNSASTAGDGASSGKQGLV
jgi:hypothetical protein